MTARRFVLVRDEDISGVSGTGVVAQGVLFDPTPAAATLADSLGHEPDRLVALQWMTEWPTSVVFHQRGLDSVEAVHGHNGRTRIEWLDAGDREVHLLTRIAHQMDDIPDRLARIERRQAAIERAVTLNTVNDTITRRTLMANFDALYTEVEANGDAVDSAVTLLENLSAQLADAADDPDEIRAIATALGENSTRLAAAVAANTPAAPEPGPEPAPGG